jgi:ribonucleoside-diphosphate reductase beta chain
MQKLLEPALEVINEIFERYETMPFGLKIEDFIGFAMDQFNKRMTRIERAKAQSLDEIYADTDL